ncbi:MAG: NAD/FAD-binding protein, partial [Pseudomonadota bacterium]|nr:NAD/FAD-binding protein [Pseudomonadota bacterium]
CFCGAGFHEAASPAGWAVADAGGGRRRPWVGANESGRIHVGATMPEVA